MIRWTPPANGKTYQREHHVGLLHASMVESGWPQYSVLAALLHRWSHWQMHMAFRPAWRPRARVGERLTNFTAPYNIVRQFQAGVPDRY